MGKQEWFLLFAFLAMLSLVGVFLPISRIYDWKVSLFRKWGWNNFASGLEKQKSWTPVMIKNFIGIFGMICVLILLILLFDFYFLYILSGKVVHGTFGQHSLWNGVTAIRVSFLLFTLFTATVFLYITIVRCRIDRSYPLIYWRFLILTVAICVYLLVPLTCAMGNMDIIYIRGIGSTDKRIYGLLYGLCGYVMVLGFLYWAAIQRPGKKKSC